MAGRILECADGQSVWFSTALWVKPFTRSSPKSQRSGLREDSSIPFFLPWESQVIGSLPTASKKT